MNDTIVRAELREVVDGLIDREEADGLKMLSTNYYLDHSYPTGPRNVGQDPIDAVNLIKPTVESVFKESDLSLESLLLQLSAEKTEYRVSHHDPDGFGIAAFNQVIGGIFRYAEEQKYQLLFTFSDLNESGQYLLDLEMFLKGDHDRIDSLLEVFPGLGPIERDWFAAIVWREVSLYESLAPMTAFETVEVARYLCKRIEYIDLEMELLQKKMLLIHSMKDRQEEEEITQRVSAPPQEQLQKRTRKPWWKFW